MRQTDNKLRPKMTASCAALLGLMRRYLAAVMDPFCSLLEIHKLMYFMQEVGQPLRLRYTKGPYGPYADNLRHLLNVIEGHFISGYGDAEDDPWRQIELIPAASQQAEELLLSHQTTRARFDRVVDLIEGFETTYGMELLSTVHWVARNEGAKTVDEAAARVHAWSDRKKTLPREHIEVAWAVLDEKQMLANN